MWWALAIQGAQNEVNGLKQKTIDAASNSINIANAKQMGARQGWETGHSEMAKAYGLQDTRTRAESNLYKLSQDKQVMNTEAAYMAKQQQADLAVSAALTGVTGSYVDVGNTTILQQHEKAKQDINKHYSKLEQQERDVIKSSTYNLYVLDQKYEAPDYVIENPGSQFELKNYTPELWKW